MYSRRPSLGHIATTGHVTRQSFQLRMNLFVSFICAFGLACGGSEPTSPHGLAPALDQVPRSSILYGVSSDVSWYTDSTYRAKALTKAKEINSQVMRVGLFWMWIEYTQGKRNWSVPDHIVNTLTASGIRPIFTVIGSPEWASHVAEAQDDYFYLHVPTDSTAFKTWVTQYADFVRAAAQRYNGKVTMWELGNEQNEAWFWRPKPNVGQYAAWYTALRSAILSVNPTALVAMGGLNGLGDDLVAPSMNGKAFLRGLYDLHVYPDIVAIHPYSNRDQSPNVHIDQASNFDDIGAVRTLMTSYNQASKPIWITEWGWSIDRLSLAQQKDYLMQSLALLESKYSSYVTVATYYSEFDPSTTYHYGLYTKDFVLRPAGAAFRDFLGKSN